MSLIYGGFDSKLWVNKKYTTYNLKMSLNKYETPANDQI